jgi:hypothetical protein
MIDPLEIQRYTEEVLRRPEFQGQAARGPSVPLWLLPVIGWLSTPVPFLGGLSVGAVILLGVGAAAVAVLVVPVVRRLRAGHPWRVRGKEASNDRRGAPGRMTVTEREEVRAAEAALAAGDGRTAVQALLRACLLMLAARGAVALERWKTSTAYVAECPPTLPPFPVLRDLAATHNDIVYAHRDVALPRIAVLKSALESHLGAP